MVASVVVRERDREFENSNMVALPHLRCLWRYLFSRAVNVTEL